MLNQGLLYHGMEKAQLEVILDGMCSASPAVSGVGGLTKMLLAVEAQTFIGDLCSLYLDWPQRFAWIDEYLVDVTRY